MDTYLISFHVATKSQSNNPDGSTQYITIIESTTDSANGSISIDTSDPTLDTFFIINGDYTASVTPV